MSKEQLTNYILNDYESFVEYRKNNEEIIIQEADFSHNVLENLDLNDIDFSGSNFAEASLTNINFTDCDLTTVDFSRANLVECNFNCCLLNGTNFNYATLNYCTFDDADMAGANFCEADLTDSDLSTSENLEAVRFDESTIWPNDDKLPEDFDCTCNKDLSSLQDDDETTAEIY